jgi:hypothetical protein
MCSQRAAVRRPARGSTGTTVWIRSQRRLWRRSVLRNYGPPPTTFAAETEANSVVAMVATRALLGPLVLRLRGEQLWPVAARLVHAVAVRWGFTSIRWCPITRLRGWPPNLDLVAKADGEVVAIESKLTEYITNRRTAKFRPSYTDAVKQIAHRSWASQFNRLCASPEEFRFFDAAQIVKHYLGLKSCYTENAVTLAYLYWEPTDEANHPVFAQHRAEVASFAAKLTDPNVRFVSRSSSDLWSEWARRRSPAWLPRHRAALIERYGVALT